MLKFSMVMMLWDVEKINFLCYTPILIAIGTPALLRRSGYAKAKWGLIDYQSFSYPPWGEGGLRKRLFRQPQTFSNPRDSQYYFHVHGSVLLRESDSMGSRHGVTGMVWVPFLCTKVEENAC